MRAEQNNVRESRSAGRPARVTELKTLRVEPALWTRAEAALSPSGLSVQDYLRAALAIAAESATPLKTIASATDTGVAAAARILAR